MSYFKSLLNQYLVKHSHKLDDWKVMFQYLRKGSFLYTFDLSQAFHVLDICDHHQTFLGFAFVVDDRKIYFIFTILPCGLSFFRLYQVISCSGQILER